MDSRGGITDCDTLNLYFKEHFALSKKMIIFARRYTTVQHSQRYKT